MVVQGGRGVWRCVRCCTGRNCCGWTPALLHLQGGFVWLLRAEVASMLQSYVQGLLWVHSESRSCQLCLKPTGINPLLDACRTGWLCTAARLVCWVWTCSHVVACCLRHGGVCPGGWWRRRAYGEEGCAWSCVPFMCPPLRVTKCCVIVGSRYGCSGSIAAGGPLSSHQQPVAPNASGAVPSGGPSSHIQTCAMGSNNWPATQAGSWCCYSSGQFSSGQVLCHGLRVRR